MESIGDVSKRLDSQSHILGKRLAPVAYAPEHSICKPDCEVCGGIGYLHRDVPISDPLFGKLMMCPNATPQVYARQSGMTEDELLQNWSNVAEINNVSKAVKAVKKILSQQSGWVFLWGPPGLAKTLILQIAVAEYIRGSREAGYVRMVEILDNIRKAFDSQDPSSEEQTRLERWTELPLLAIDEFDRINATEWATNRRFLLLDKRYRDAIYGKSITLFASNRSPESFDDYLVSRIYDGRFEVVELKGVDVRRSMGSDK